MMAANIEAKRIPTKDSSAINIVIPVQMIMFGSSRDIPAKIAPYPTVVNVVHESSIHKTKCARNEPTTATMDHSRRLTV
jgi:hypothetical protein